MGKKVSKKILSVILVLMLIFATQSTAFAWGHSKWVTKPMNTSNSVLGMVAKDVITYYINEKGGIEKVNVQQHGVNFLGFVSIEPKGVKILYGTNKVQTFWSLNISIPIYGPFSQPFKLKGRTIEYTLYNDQSISSRIIKK